MTSENRPSGARATLAADFSNLPFGEQLVLWAVRLWVRGLKHDCDPSRLLHRGFKLAGVAEAYRGLDALMAVIRDTATTSIDIRCADCPDISADEHRLLAVIAARQQDQRRSEADALLAAWLPPPARPCAIASAEVVALTLHRKDLMIRPRPWLHDMADGTPATNSPSQGSPTLH